jgi:hypothetical protein
MDKPVAKLALGGADGAYFVLSTVFLLGIEGT